MADGPRVPPAGIDQVLTGLGASVHETIDICGYALDRAFPTGSLAQVFLCSRSGAETMLPGSNAPARRPGATPLLPRKTSTGPSQTRPWGSSSAAGTGCPQVLAAMPLSEMSPASGEQRWCLNSEAEGSTEDWSMPEWRIAQPRGETGPGARQADLLAHPPTTRVRRIRPAEGLVHPAIGHPDAASTTKVAPNTG